MKRPAVRLGGWRTRIAVVAATAVGASPLLFIGGHAVAAADCQYYYAYGAADGVLGSVAVANLFPLTNQVDSEGPSAHALVNSGASGAIAGSPYPGDTAYTAPGLGGVDPSVYPLTAKSQYPTTPHKTAGAGAISLTADSQELSSKANAFDGAGSAGASGTSAGSSESNASASCGDAGIVASADTDTNAVNVADTLRIGRIHSQAKAVMDVNGNVTLTYGLDAAEVTIAGQTVKIDDKGLEAGGQNVPLPNPLADVLKSQGITLSYVAPVKDPKGKGVTAPGLEVSVPLPLDKATLGSTPTIVTFTFGRAYAAVDGSFSASGGVTGTDSAGVTGGASVPGTSTGSAGGLGGGGLPATTGSSTPSGGGSQPVVAGSASQPLLQTQALGLNLPQIDWQLLYLALVVGAVAVVGGGLFIRHIAERLRWT
jgi:hypothetical protein